MDPTSVGFPGNHTGQGLNYTPIFNFIVKRTGVTAVLH